MFELLMWAALLVGPVTGCLIVLAHRLDRRSHDDFMASLREGLTDEWRDSIDAKAKSYIPE